jgi:hypothetical protein
MRKAAVTGGIRTLFQFDGETFHRVAGTGTPAALVEFQKQRGPFRSDASSQAPAGTNVPLWNLWAQPTAPLVFGGK